MSGRTFYIATMGCQMNVYDSDLVARSLARDGLKQVHDPEGADVILINTCTVRAKPEQKAYSLLGRMSRIKKRRPHVILGVIGCLAQQKGSGIISRFPRVDLVMGPREIGGLPAALQKLEQGHARVVATRLDPPPPGSPPAGKRIRDRVSAYISVMEGCDNFCAYCIVPFVRGREVSRPPGDILSEAKTLLSEGVREITLLGQNVNSYRWEEKGDPWNFARLLRSLNDLEGLLRLRFTTSHPKDLSPELAECFGDLSRLCGHIHLPFQAGSDAVLRRMGRGYTRKTYLARIEKLREVRPDIAITSDVMVGFPGESPADFEETLDLMEHVRFDALFSFCYSDRGGTRACRMDGKIPEAEKAARLDRLQSLQAQITLEKNKDLEGRCLDVLIEGKSRRPGQFTGRTECNRIVNFLCNNIEIGRIVNVEIKEGLLHSLRGEIREGGSPA